MNAFAWILALGALAILVALALGPVLSVKALFHRGRQGRRPLI